jgi:hypothetical protein
MGLGNLPGPRAVEIHDRGQLDAGHGRQNPRVMPPQVADPDDRYAHRIVVPDGL